MTAAIGASSCEELKDLFLRFHHKDDTSGMMALYFQKGASEQMLSLYRSSLPRPHEETILSACIADVSYSGECWPGRDPWTLKPEKVLAVQFAVENVPGLRADSRRFFIGRHEGRYFLTMPTGEDRPEPEPTLAAAESLLREIVEILASQLPLMLADAKCGLENQGWKSAFIDQRWTPDDDASSISRLRVVLQDGTTFSNLQIPDAVAGLMDDIGTIKNQAFAEPWFGIKITVRPNGTFQVEYDVNPNCADDPAFFESD